jgi:hypothetical protein
MKSHIIGPITNFKGSMMHTQKSLLGVPGTPTCTRTLVPLYRHRTQCLLQPVVLVPVSTRVSHQSRTLPKFLTRQGNIFPERPFRSNAQSET